MASLQAIILLYSLSFVVCGAFLVIGIDEMISDKKKKQKRSEKDD